MPKKTKPDEERGPGDNTGISHERLRTLVKRIENVEEDKAAVGEDLKEIYSEVKSSGFDAKIVRIMVRDRRMEIEKRRERDELMALYKAALGMDD